MNADKYKMSAGALCLCVKGNKLAFEHIHNNTDKRKKKSQAITSRHLEKHKGYIKIIKKIK